MGSDPAQLHEQLDELERQLEELRRRVSALEAREEAPTWVAQPGPDPFRPEHEPRQASGESAGSPPLSGGSAALIGRTLIVLGGAYLVRALSDRELVPPLAGAGAALLYAVVWLVQSDRAAARGHETSAVFHGVTGALIAYPLLWETTVVFGLLPAPATALAMLVVSGTALIVASRRNLSVVAWVAVIAHLATGAALLIGTQAFLPVSLVLLALAAVVETPRIRDGWPMLRWPAAFGADAAVLVLLISSLRMTRAPTATGELPGLPVLAAVLALPLLYLASVGERTARRGQPMSGFEVAQLSFALVAGLGGGVVVQGARGLGPEWIGLLALALGIVCYAAASGVLDRRFGGGLAFHAFSTYGGLLALAGSALLLHIRSAAVVGTWCAFSAVALAFGARGRQPTLRLHGALYAGAATIASGLVLSAGEGLLADPATWRPLSSGALAVLLFAGAAFVALTATTSRDAGRWNRVPQTVLAALLTAVIAGLTVRLAAPTALAVAGGDASDAGLAALRSIVIALLALVLALLGSGLRRPELRWLVYPLLAVGGAKLAWEDLRVGDPIALFASLAALGGALLVTPRLMRDRALVATPPDPPIQAEPAE